MMCRGPVSYPEPVAGSATKNFVICAVCDAPFVCGPGCCPNAVADNKATSTSANLLRVGFFTEHRPSPKFQQLKTSERHTLARSCCNQATAFINTQVVAVVYQPIWSIRSWISSL